VVGKIQFLMSAVIAGGISTIIAFSSQDDNTKDVLQSE
jgi:hypothetical protein